MDSAFIAKGHGYDNPQSFGMTRCTAFDGFTILAEPLGGFDEASRDSRHFPKADGSNGVTYDSHAIKLAEREGARPHDRDLFILMHNGSGREVLKISPIFYEGGVTKAALLAMPERVLYGFLYMIWQTASNARSAAETATALKWRDAYLDGRIRKTRPKGGYYKCFVESEFERDLRTGKERPSRVAIDVATGAVTPA